jgi:hypothetical protein
MLEPRQVRALALAGFVGALGFVALTFFVGTEIKGAKRWISLPGFSLQPSEFLKPTFAVVAAWLFALSRKHERFPGDAIAIALYAATIGLLLLQPDIGMAFVVSAVWFAQFFLAGLRMFWVVGLVGAGGGGAVLLYMLFPHFESRVNRFLDPASGDTFQVNMAMEAFLNGGLMGRGPGEGRAKSLLPDAHSDFIFAVAAEEFGLMNPDDSQRVQIVLAEVDDGSVIGIRVDEICGHHQIVVKSIREHFSIHGISGATILGDGNVALILDVNQLGTEPHAKPTRAPINTLKPEARAA